MKGNPIDNITLLGENVPRVRKTVPIKEISNLRSVVQPGFESHCAPWENVVAVEHNGLFEVLNDPEGIIREIMAVGAVTLELSVLLEASPEDIRFYKACLPILPPRSMSFTPGKAIRKLFSLGELLDRLVANYQSAVGESARLPRVIHVIFGKKFVSKRTITNGFRKFVVAKETSKTETVTTAPSKPKQKVKRVKQPQSCQTDVPLQKTSHGQTVEHRVETQLAMDI